MVVSRQIRITRTVFVLGLVLGSGRAHASLPAQDAPAGESRVTCGVEGKTRILLIAPDGLVVKKGQLVCELDSAPVRQILANQRIIVEAAKKAAHAARDAHEIAEITKQEYIQGIFKQDLATLEGEIKLAESDLVRSADRFEWATRMHAKGFVGQAQKVSEELNFQKATFALKQAQEHLQLLKKYSGPKTIKALDSTLDQTRFDARPGSSAATRASQVGATRAASRALPDLCSRRRPYRSCPQSVDHAGQFTSAYRPACPGGRTAFSDRSPGESERYRPQIMRCRACRRGWRTAPARTKARKKDESSAGEKPRSSRKNGIKTSEAFPRRENLQRTDRPATDANKRPVAWRTTTLRHALQASRTERPRILPCRPVGD